jgi:Tfp pilus assembly protein FimV
MTRENKLALVVGFGLILIVGILISDHFSAARRQESPQLAQAVDPLAEETRWDDPDLIAVRPEPAASEGGLVIDPAVHAPTSATTPPALPRSREPGVNLPPEEVRELPFIYHEVREGDSLTTICREHYGDASLIAELATYNEIDDPNRLRVGHRLRIPRAGDLVRGRPAPPRTEPAPANAPATPRTYTVQKNDSLSEIAQRVLGSGRKYLAIYEANRDVLSSPDALRPGMVLRIPGNDR